MVVVAWREPFRVPRTGFTLTERMVRYFRGLWWRSGAIGERRADGSGGTDKGRWRAAEAVMIPKRRAYFTAGTIPRPADRLRRRRPVVRRKPSTDGAALYECGMRRTSSSNWNATQYAIIAHFGISSLTRNTARRFKLLTRLEFRRPPDSRNLEH